MSNKAKHTKGEWVIEHPINENAEWLAIRSNAVPLLNGKKFSIAKVQYQVPWQDNFVQNLGRKESEVQISKSEAEANAKLIAEAGTVANETGKTPKQLAKINKELLEALTDVRKWYEANHQKYLGEYTPVCFSKALSAIHNATM